MKAILLAIARARSGTMRFVQNVAKTRLAARYPTGAAGAIACNFQIMIRGGLSSHRMVGEPGLSSAGVRIAGLPALGQNTIRSALSDEARL